MKGKFWKMAIAGLFFAGTALAQIGETNTLIDRDTEIISGFENNLDSLLNLWYVQQIINPDELDTSYIPEADTIWIDYPDSVYIARLDSLPFAIDLSYNRIVKNFIDLYIKKRRERVRVMLTLSDYYFPLFEEIFDRYQIPQELKYMAIIESALNPRAVSPVGATGIWQFMYYTGKQYNLSVNSLIDERRDPYKATEAAARFMKDLYKIYKDWNLVIAAYNCGPGNVNRAIRRSGGKRNYWDIYYFLPRETRGYVPAFVAAAYVMNYHEEHNLKPIPVDFTLNNDTLHIKEKLHLKQVAEVLNLSLKHIRDLNPHYKYDMIPGDGKNYILRLPQEATMRFIELEDSIFAWKDSIYFNKENMIVNPTARNYSIPELPSDKYTKYVYTVKPGDNLGFISMWYDVRISNLRYWNNIRSNMIRSGQKLVVYVPNGKADKYKDINRLSFAEKQKIIGKTVAYSSKPELVITSEDLNKYVTYKVRSGDTLWDIAKLYPGVTDSDIAKLNNLNYGAKIKPGQVLKIKPII
ncbi:MAG: transglycosylase SLT domain-containing protein [Bacteroidota bacterium]